jgi:hypothetical protein
MSTPPDCACVKELLEPHRDGCAELRRAYLRAARRMVRRLVPILTKREGGDDLDHAVQVLGTVQTPARHPTRLIEAGKLLQTFPRDVHAAYLGVRLQAIGEHLKLRRAPTRAEMVPLWDAWQLSSDLLFGEVPNTPRHLIPASRRLDGLRQAAARLAAERHRVPDHLVQHALEIVELVHELVAEDTAVPLRPAALLRRADQDKNQEMLTAFVATEGKGCTVIAGSPETGGPVLGTFTYSRGHVLTDELVAAAALVRCEADAWPPSDQSQAMDLLQHIHTALHEPAGPGAPLVMAGGPRTPWARHP